MICRMQVSWSNYHLSTNREFCLEAWEALWPFLTGEARDKAPSHFYSTEVIADPNEIQAALSDWPEFKLELKRFSNNLWVGAGGEPRAPFSVVPDDVKSGRVTHIHIPNVGLWSMDEVQLLEDSCTDKLQGMLDDGWRIIAVCPPSEQRRPDYILGRNSAYEKSRNR